MTPDPKGPEELLVYANWVRLEATPYDVSMDFGYRPTEEPPRDFPVRLVMTWEHAKDVLLLLDNAVKQYGENVGAIRDLGAEVTPAAKPAVRPPQRRKKK